MATNNGPDVMEFAKEEEKVLQLWQKLDAFQSSLKQSKGRPRYYKPGHLIHSLFYICRTVLMVGCCNKAASLPNIHYKPILFTPHLCFSGETKNL